MVTKTKIDELDLTVDRFQALEAEVERLRIELSEEQAHSASLKRLVDKAKLRIRELDHPNSEGVDLGFGSGAGEAATSETTTGETTNSQPATNDNANGDVANEDRGGIGRLRGSRRRRGAKSEKKQAENVYVFDDHDEATVAFDEFFANPDPDLDKVRGFLLD